MPVLQRLRQALRRRLRLRMLVSNILTLLFFLCLLGYLSFRTARVSLQQEVYEANRVLATLAAREVNAQYDALVTNVRLLGRQLAASSVSPTLQARTMLELRRASPLTYRALYLFDSQGEMQIHLADSLEDLLAIQDIDQIVNRPPNPISDHVRAAYQVAQNGTLFVSIPRILGADQVPTMHMGIPLQADGNSTEQTLVAEIDLRDVWRRIDEIYIGQTGRAYLVSQKGTIIAHPDRAYIGQPLAPELAPVVDGYEGRAEYTDPLSGRTLLASYSPVGRQSGWGLVVEQERAEALAPINRIAFITLGLLLAAMTLATVVTVLVGQSITRPILHLAQVTRIIARTGDLDQDVALDRQDEVGQLADTFNQMIASLRQARAKLKAHSEQLEEMVEARTHELQEAQEQLIRQEKLAVLGQLAGGVGHELRNPLGAISNAVYFLRLTLDNAEETTVEYLDLISAEIRTATKIISDLLDFARIRLPDREHTTVETLVAQVFTRHPPPENVRLATEISENLPALFVDPGQITIVLDNLVTNAYQAMSEGGSLVVRAQAADDHISLSLADTGPGITQEHMDKIFQPLFTTKARGIGLGLAISKRLVKANRGQIRVESTEGVGTTFTLRLPTKESP